MNKEKSIVRLIYSILMSAEKRYWNQQLRDSKTHEVTATYGDCIEYLTNKYEELKTKENKNEETNT